MATLNLLLIGSSDGSKCTGTCPVDTGAKPICADAGKEWTEELTEKIPMPNQFISQADARWYR